MNHFIFKSANRLIKNESINFRDSLSIIQGQIRIIQSQNRALRQDLVDVNGKLDRILVDKHLQMQVDTYFDKDELPESDKELDEE